MNLSVIIPALNEAQVIGRAIESAWTCGANEVIVADGGSDDDTVACARQLRATVIESEPGRAIQQNAAAAQASGETLLFLHADNWLDVQCGSQLRAALEHDRVLGGAFRQRIDDPRVAFRLIERGNAWRVRMLRTPYGDQGLFMRRGLFERLGAYPNVALMEDLLLMRKLRKVARPRLLDGPIHVSARRWRTHGIVRQTFRNWAMVSAHRCGASPDWLARFYQPHRNGK